MQYDSTGYSCVCDAEMLDGREITFMTREFLSKWQESRVQHQEQLRASQELRQHYTPAQLAAMERAMAWPGRAENIATARAFGRVLMIGGARSTSHPGRHLGDHLPPIEAHRMSRASRVQHHASQVAAFYEQTKWVAGWSFWSGFCGNTNVVK